MSRAKWCVKCGCAFDGVLAMDVDERCEDCGDVDHGPATGFYLALRDGTYRCLACAEDAGLDAPTIEATDAPGVTCATCGAAQLGPWCYAVVVVGERRQAPTLHATVPDALAHVAKVSTDDGTWRVVEIPPGETADYDGTVVAEVRRGRLF